MKNNQSLLTIGVRHGEHTCKSLSIHPHRNNKKFQQYLANFYPGKGHWEDGSRYFCGGEIVCWIESARPITDEQAQVLRETGVAP